MGIVGDIAAPIDELVGLLDKFSPGALVTLRAKHPNMSDLLRPGLIAGKGASSDASVRLEVCSIGLSEAVRLAARVQDAISDRLCRSRRIQVVGQVLALSAGASFFGVLAIKASDVAKYSVAILNLVGSILTLVAQHLQTAPISRGRLLSELLSDLISARFKAEAMLRELEISQRIGANATPLKIVAQANELAMKISTLASQLNI